MSEGIESWFASACAYSEAASFNVTFPAGTRLCAAQAVVKFKSTDDAPDCVVTWTHDGKDMRCAPKSPGKLAAVLAAIANGRVPS